MKRRPALLLLASLALPFLRATPAAAQAAPANGILLVSRPGMPDPRFRESVVLVHQTPDYSTVGVILNKSTPRRLSEIRPGAAAEPLYFGGPVMQNVVVALFKAPTPPEHPAFRVHRDIYLSLHPAVVDPLLAAPGPSVRLFSGFSGWAPRQLQGEMERRDWHVLPVTEDLLFRRDHAGMWEELLERTRGRRAQRGAALYWPA